MRLRVLAVFCTFLAFTGPVMALEATTGNSRMALQALDQKVNARILELTALVEVLASEVRESRLCAQSKQIYDGSGCQDAGSSAPTGTIAAFDLAACPSGWSEYTAARGRFLRGIDPTGNNDPDGVRGLGSIQNDALQNITGYFRGGNGDIGGAFRTRSSVGMIGSRGTGWLNRLDFDASRVARTSTETRPKNVAVRFCRKN